MASQIDVRSSLLSNPALDSGVIMWKCEHGCVTILSHGPVTGLFSAFYGVSRESLNSSGMLSAAYTFVMTQP